MGDGVTTRHQDPVALRGAALGPGAPGAPQVLIAGAGLGTDAATLWGDAAVLLGPGVHVIGVDLPGHGTSPAWDGTLRMADLGDAVAALIDRLRGAGTIARDTRVAYAGVSAAGLLGLQLAADHPGHVDTVAVICSGARIGDPQAWRDRARTVDALGTPTMVAPSAQRWFAPDFVQDQPERTSRLLHSLYRTDRRSYARVCEMLAETDLRGRLAEIPVPVLAVSGGHDQVCPPALGEEIAAAVPQGAIAVVPDVAHQAPYENPQAISDLLRRHLMT